MPKDFDITQDMEGWDKISPKTWRGGIMQGEILRGGIICCYDIIGILLPSVALVLYFTEIRMTWIKIFSEPATPLALGMSKRPTCHVEILESCAKYSCPPLNAQYYFQLSRHKVCALQ